MYDWPGSIAAFRADKHDDGKLMRRISFFDLDGTLTDPQVGITTCIAQALRQLQHDVPTQEALNGWIGPPLFDSFRDYLGSEPLAHDALKHYRARFATVGLFENTMYPGIQTMLADVARAGSTMYVVTSKPRVFAERIVQHFGIASCFAAVYGSELDGRLTDKGELIAHAMHEESAEAEQVTMIGDRRHDIAGAKMNAVNSVGVLWGFGSREELRSAGADHLCARVADLPRQLGEH